VGIQNENKDCTVIPNHTLPLDELPVGCVNSHFLDSGAFAMWSKSQKYAKEHHVGRWDYYQTKEFRKYLKEYAEFVLQNQNWIDLCANLDVIGNPDLTWENQQKLEKLGVKPVPVVHYGTDLKWLAFYMNKGYDLIGLGGLVGSTGEEDCKRWIDRCFQMVCSGSNRLPLVKLHGFGVTSYHLLITYPWYSVDSTSWTKVGAFGGILVPHWRYVDGQWGWDFTDDPYVMKVADDRKKEEKEEDKSKRVSFRPTGLKPKNPDRMKHGKHILTLSKAERGVILKWLKHIKVPLGQFDHYGDAIEWGVTTHHTYRKAANLMFFEELRKWLPSYPWRFKSKKQKGFGLT
jgi:hypothetical protein